MVNKKSLATFVRTVGNQAIAGFKHFLNNVKIGGTLTINAETLTTPATSVLTLDGNNVVRSATAFAGISVDATSKVKHEVKAGVAINKGQAVYVTSADGTNMIVGLASNATEATSSKTMGLMETTVAINGKGNVITEGLLDGLDTSAATIGDPVWLGTNGNLIYGIANKPFAPAHMVAIGIVTRVNANNGEIFVKVQNGFELEELHNVQISTPSTGQLIRRDSDNLWKNWTPNFLVPSNVSGTTNYISKFTGTNTVGDSQVFDNGTNVGVGTASPSEKLHVNGRIRVATIDNGTGDFLTASATGVITERTAAQVLTDIGAQPLLTNPVIGSGTSTRVAFWNNSNSLSSNANLFWDNTNSRLGIGTATPLHQLDVAGNVRFQSIGAATTDTDQFLVSDSGVIKRRTGAEMLSDIDVIGYVASRGENLVTNGTGYRKSNYNFSSFTYTGAEANYTTGSFYDATFNSTRFNDEQIAVDVTKRYRVSISARQFPYVGARYYVGFTTFDVDGNNIQAINHMYVANTLTTLAQPLNNGDTVVYLTNAANWINTGTAGVNTHLRSFIFWDYSNSQGYLYPPLTYSRNWFGNAWDPGNINFTNNTITLRVPWSGGNKPAGTQVSNGSAGGTYKYNVVSNAIIPQTWTNYSGIIDGVDLSGTNVTDKFPPGTATMKLLFLNNRDTVGAGVYYTNLSIALDFVSTSTTSYILNQNGSDQSASLRINGTAQASRLISTVATGTAPLTVTSTTRVANLNVATAGTADTWTTGRTITIGNTGKSVNGSTDVSWTLAEIGAQVAGSYAAASHTHAVATTSADGFMSSLDKTKLDGIESGAQVNTVNSVAGKTGIVTLVKGDVGLANVDNTADSTKSVLSSATLTTARTLTIGSTGKTFNGSADVSWTLAEIGAYAATNPSGYTSNTGTVTSVAGTGGYGGLTLSGTVTSSGNITLGGTPTGTWPISVSGNSATSTVANNLVYEDNRTISPSELTATRLRFGFTSWANNNTAPYADFLHLRSYTDASGGNDNLVMFRKDAIGMRIYQQVFGSASAYSTFKDVAFTDSNITGNAATATTLATARSINGTSFNGSADITTANWGTGRTITIGSTGKSVNGSANVSWSLAEIGAQPAGSYLTAEVDTLQSVTTRGSSTTTGASFGGQLVVGNATSGNAIIEVGQNRTANGFALIDLVGDTTYTDYGLRLIRHNTGANALSQLVHRGTGNLDIATIDIAPIVFKTIDTERARIASNGNFGINTTSPSQALHVVGGARITGAVYDSANQPGTAGQVLSSTGTGTQWITSSGGGGGSTISVSDEGTSIGTSFTNLNFIGDNVSAAASGSTAVIEVTGRASTASIYYDDIANPFVIPGGGFSDVEINTQAVMTQVPSSLTGSNKLIAVVTFGVNNVSNFDNFNGFKFRLYNSGPMSDIQGTTHSWTGYMSKDGGCTTSIFTFHIPIDASVVTGGDTIVVQADTLTNVTPEIYYCSLTFIEGTN